MRDTYHDPIPQIQGLSRHNRTSDDGTLFGKVAYIRDLITYEADTLPKLVKEFHQSVDAYLEDCEELGKVPDTPYQGCLLSPPFFRQTK